MEPTSSASTWPFSHDEELAMWRFLIAHQLTYDYSFLSVWEKFKRATGTERSVQSLYDRFFNDMIPRLHLTHFDIETKLWLYEKYRIVITKEAAEMLSTFAELVVDECGFLIKYSLKANSDTFPVSHPFSDDEDLLMWEYLIDCRHRSISYELWKDFKRLTGTYRTITELCQRFQTHMIYTLHRMPFDIPTKVKLYAKYHIKVDKQYIKVICRHMNVTCDKQGWIVDYDGKFEPEKTQNEPFEDQLAAKMERIEKSIESVIERVREMPMERREHVNWTVYTSAIQEMKLDDFLPPTLSDQSSAEEDIDVVETSPRSAAPKRARIEMKDEGDVKEESVWIQNRTALSPTPEMNMFVETLKEEITDVVDVSNKKLIEVVVRQLAAAAAMENRAHQDQRKDLKTSMADFLLLLKTFCTDVKSSKLESRMDSAIQSIISGKIPNHQLTNAIEATLTILDC